MYRVVETFSGIGSQVQAMKNIGMEHEILATVEWDINAICAYDVLHNDSFDTSEYDKYSKKELVEMLNGYSLSSDGKKVMGPRALAHMSLESLKRLILAIDRNNNLVSIMDVSGDDLPDSIDILTYSFPCQDLSVCGFWHGNTSGIDRDAMNRSGLLWEVERLIFELRRKEKNLPKVLVMENVSNILSDTHKKNFEEWKNYLSSVGYYNHVYTLCAKDFGIPQTRKRVFMISIQAPENRHQELDYYFQQSNLEDKDYVAKFVDQKHLSEFLKLDYSDKVYRREAEDSQPNFTPSRQKIFNESKIIADRRNVIKDSVTTITTKQDRNPNSGLVLFDPVLAGKAPYRNLTGRECIMLMGFDEEQFNKLNKYNFNVSSARKMFTNNKYIKMAGNSIVVQVLECIFRQIIEIDDFLRDELIDLSVEVIGA